MWRSLRSFFDKLRASRDRSDEQVESPQGDVAATSLAIKIVALLTSEQDRQLLLRIAGEQGWSVRLAATCDEACDLLQQEKAPIVLCDRDFPGDGWRNVIQRMSSAPQPVYAILLSRVADDYLWNEVIQNGGYDLLATPLGEEELLRAIRLGWSYWSNSMRMPTSVAKGST